MHRSHPQHASHQVSEHPATTAQASNSARQSFQRRSERSSLLPLAVHAITRQSPSTYRSDYRLRTHASEPSPPTAGALVPRDSTPGQTIQPDNGPRRPVSHRSDANRNRTDNIAAPRDAPEPDSQYNDHNSDSHCDDTSQDVSNVPSHASAETRPRSNTTPARNLRLRPPDLDHPTGTWWRRSGSNRRPPACKAGALPAELRPQQSSGSSGSSFRVQSQPAPDYHRPGN